MLLMLLLMHDNVDDNVVDKSGDDNDTGLTILHCVSHYRSSILYRKSCWKTEDFHSNPIRWSTPIKNRHHYTRWKYDFIMLKRR